MDGAEKRKRKIKALGPLESEDPDDLPEPQDMFQIPWRTKRIGGLSEEEETFCREYAIHGNIRVAYMKARPDQKSTSYSGVWIRRPDIQDRIKEIRAEARKLTTITLEAHLKELAEIRDAARSEGKFSAAVSAEIARGKAAGLYTTKIKKEVMFPQLNNLSSAELAEQLEKLEAQTDARLIEHQPSNDEGTAETEESSGERATEEETSERET